MFDLFSFSASERSFSPDSKSSIDTEKNFDISFNESMLGYPLPDSHFEIAVRDTYKASANSSCVRPLLFLKFWSFSLNYITQSPYKHKTDLHSKGKSR